MRFSKLGPCWPPSTVGITMDKYFINFKKHELSRSYSIALLLNQITFPLSLITSSFYSQCSFLLQCPSFLPADLVLIRIISSSPVCLFCSCRNWPCWKTVSSWTRAPSRSCGAAALRSPTRSCPSLGSTPTPDPRQTSPLRSGQGSISVSLSKAQTVDFYHVLALILGQFFLKADKDGHPVTPLKPGWVSYLWRGTTFCW